MGWFDGKSSSSSSGFFDVASPTGAEEMIVDMLSAPPHQPGMPNAGLSLLSTPSGRAVAELVLGPAATSKLELSLRQPAQSVSVFCEVSSNAFHHQHTA